MTEDKAKRHANAGSPLDQQLAAEDALALRVAKEMRWRIRGDPASSWNELMPYVRDAWIKDARAIIEIVRAG